MAQRCHTKQCRWRCAPREPVPHARPSACEHVLTPSNVDDKALDVRVFKAVDSQQGAQVLEALERLRTCVPSSHQLTIGVVRDLARDVQLIADAARILVTRRGGEARAPLKLVHGLDEGTNCFGDV